jgi:hypothetical protein
MWHGYFAVEDLNLNASQRQTLVEELCSLGPSSHPQPACLCHWRTRLDGQAAIFEALFSEAVLTIARFKQRLGAIFGVDPGDIGHDATVLHFGDGDTPVVTFSYGGTDYLRFALFGGLGVEWADSGNEVRAYLKAYSSEWEEPAS